MSTSISAAMSATMLISMSATMLDNVQTIFCKILHCLWKIYILLCSFNFCRHHLTTFTFTQLWDSNETTSWDWMRHILYFFCAECLHRDILSKRHVLSAECRRLLAQTWLSLLVKRLLTSSGFLSFLNILFFWPWLVLVFSPCCLWSTTSWPDTGWRLIFSTQNNSDFQIFKAQSWGNDEEYVDE